MGELEKRCFEGNWVIYFVFFFVCVKVLELFVGLDCYYLFEWFFVEFLGGLYMILVLFLVY